MSANMRRAMMAYGSQSLDADVNTASPHRLIVLLFEGAIKAIHLAKLHLNNKDIAAKGASISKAIAIIEDGLRLSLDREAGGEMAANLDALYEFIAYSLLEANLHNDVEKLDLSAQLLSDLKESWEKIGNDPALNQQATTPDVQYGRV
ncbi:flagellar export chaperone FliS [Chitinibacter tainanensis]|uniref:flagellar export chaperone FliS n=1 Tax=Chitinibacter tainanensis TaxID=230667 RepID=UPI0023534341|nr:flagellar export chaperone FliS [Chitinibacter tainanensis]